MSFTQNRLPVLSETVALEPSFPRFVVAELDRVSHVLIQAGRFDRMRKDFPSLMVFSITRANGISSDDRCTLAALRDAFAGHAESLHFVDCHASHFAYACAAVAKALRWRDKDSAASNWFEAFMHLAAIQAGERHGDTWDFIRDGDDSPLADAYLASLAA